MKILKYCIAIFFVFSVFIVEKSTGEIVIICTNDVDQKKLSKAEIKKIFTGKKKKWSSGESINVVMNSEESIYSEFAIKYTRKSISQLKCTWRQLVFTGKGYTPARLKGEKLFKYLDDKKGAISFCTKEDSIINSYRVKTIAIEEEDTK